MSFPCLGSDPIEIRPLRRKEPVSFETEILPILKQNCLACHSAVEKQGSLVLESPQGILRGGDSGPSAVPGRGAESLLLAVASHVEEPVMPPEENDVEAKNLTPEELGLIQLWIDQGAKGSGGFDQLSPKQWQPLPPGVHPVQAITLTEDGQFVAASRANQIFLYHVPTGQFVAKLADPTLDSDQTTGIAHRDLVQSLAFNVDGELLASGGFRKVKLWRRPRDVELRRIVVKRSATRMALSPDERRLAIATTDHEVQLLNAQSGEQITTLQGHTDAITSLRFTQDGELLISSSLDQTVRFWDLRNVTQQAILETPSPIRDLELLDVKDDESSAVMPRVVTAHEDKRIGVWQWPHEESVSTTDDASNDENVPNESEPNWIQAHSKAVTSLAIDPTNPQQFYSGSLDGTVRRWNLDSNRSVAQLNHGGPINAISVSPDGSRVASAGENARVKLFENGRQIAELRGDVRLAAALNRSQQQLNRANARLGIVKRQLEDAEKDLPKKTEAEKGLSESLAAANEDVAAKQKVVEENLAAKVTAEKAAIEASAIAKDALREKELAEGIAKQADSAVKAAQYRLTRLQQAISSDPQNQALRKVWDSAEQDYKTCQQHASDLSDAVKEPTQRSKKMADAANEMARIVNEVQQPYNDAVAALKTAQSNQNLLSQQHALAAKELIEAKDLIPRRKTLLVQTEKNKASAEQQLRSAREALQTSEQPIHTIAFSRDGSTLVSGGAFERFQTWDGKNGEALSAFAGYSHGIKQLCFLRDGSIVSLSGDDQFRVWDANPAWVLERTLGDESDPGTIAHRATAVDFNHDSTQLLVAGGVPSRSGELHVFDLIGGDRALYLPTAHNDVVYSARFSPDGQKIASAGADRYVRTFEVASSLPLRQFEGHTDYVLGVGWKSDGESIASSSADRTIKLWQSNTGDQQRTINQQLTKHVTSVQFIGDTDTVISSSGDGRVRIHRGSNGGVIRSFRQGSAWIHCVAVTADGKIAASGDADGTVTIWNATNGQVLHELKLD